MDERRCVLCDQPAGENARDFSVTPEAKALLALQFPGVDPALLIAQSVLCTRCAALPIAERQELARTAAMRELTSYQMDRFRERLSMRIDIAHSIDLVPLTDETWEWLNLVGYAVTRSQDGARALDENTEWFKPYEDYKWILVGATAKDINALGAIYLALRCEWTHQAAALLRTLCESVITLRFIAQDKTARSKQFIGYGAVDEYKLVDNLLAWDAEHSRAEHVAKMEEFRATKKATYDEARANYSAEKSGKPFRNWCNKHIADMAKEAGLERLYRVVYGQTSAYIHGSAWSLRAVGAFTRRGYDARRALIDTSMMVRLTMAVWFEWSAFCDKELGWSLCTDLAALKERVDELQAALDATTRG